MSKDLHQNNTVNISHKTPYSSSHNLYTPQKNTEAKKKMNKRSKSGIQDDNLPQKAQA